MGIEPATHGLQRSAPTNCSIAYSGIKIIANDSITFLPLVEITRCIILAINHCPMCLFIQHTYTQNEPSAIPFSIN